MGSPASQGAVGSYMAVPPQEAGQADFGLPAIGGRQWMIILGASLALYLIIELRKGALRGRKGRGRPVISPT